MDSFATQRLSVRDWSPDLADAQKRARLAETLASVLSPKVLRHLPGPLKLAATKDAVSDWMSARETESEVYLVSDLKTRDLLGLLILAFDSLNPEQRECHIGYLLAERAWGSGYATELVIGLVAALNDKGPMTIIGGVGNDNAESARVLEKAGFHKSSELSDRETSMYVCETGSAHIND